MGFKLHLATAFPDHTDPQFQSTNIPPFVVPELEVSSSYFSDRLTFPPPGLARSLHYPNVPSTAAFELSATINVDRDQLRFGYSGLMGEDSLFFGQAISIDLWLPFGMLNPTNKLFSAWHTV
jgi:hypothetical protein